MPINIGELLPSANEIRKQSALKEKRPKSTCAFWPQPKPKRKSLIDELTKPSGLSEEEKVKRRCTGSQTYFARIPRGRAINQMEAGWEKTPTGIFDD
jgi:hypothetical protein